MGVNVETRTEGHLFIKRALNDEGAEALAREALTLRTNDSLVDDMGAPHYRGAAFGGEPEQLRELFLTNLGPHTDPRPVEELAVVDALIGRLETLRLLGLRHGDLTRANMIWREGELYITDWCDVTKLADPPRKQRERDVITAMRALPEWGIDTARIARRWIAIAEHEGATLAHPGESSTDRRPTLYDWGCNAGRISRLARLTGYPVLAVDRDARVMPDQGPGLATLTADLTAPEALPARLASYNVTPEPDSIGLLLSVLPYVIDEAGWQIGSFLVRTLAMWHARLYVECQTIGDGPGQLATQDSWRKWLEGITGASVEPVIDIPVAGREPRTRTVFVVTS